MPSLLGIMRSRATYLWVAFTLPALTIFGHSLAPEQPIFKGQDLGVIVGLIGLLLTGVLWLPYGFDRWDRLTSSFLIIFTLAWIYEVIRIQIDGSTFNLTAFALPALLIMVFLKPPRVKDINFAGLVLAYSLALISLANLILGHFGVGSNGFMVADNGPLRIPVVSELLGLSNRWGGPFGSVNLAAPVGASLLIYAFTRVGTHRIIIGLSGLMILGLSQGRNAVLAAIAGLIVLFLYGTRVSEYRHRLALRITTLALACVAFVAYIAFLDPTFNGRTQIWVDYFHVWMRSPIFGVGDSEVNAYINERNLIPGTITHSHAHSVLLDGSMRFGLVMLILMVIVFVIAFWSSNRALALQNPAPMAIVVGVFVAGLAETLSTWTYVSVQSAFLLLAVLLAAVTVHAKNQRPSKAA